MSATAAGTDFADLTDKQQRILQYLREEGETKTYFKSRLIAADLDFTAKEVGANMRTLLNGDYDISVEKWGYSSGTTWKVSV